jgi:stringent starvation protein B
MSQSTSQKPYFLRALYEWCTDNNYTPYLTVQVDSRTRVPMQHVKDDSITLDISVQATTQLRMGNELIEFNARFSGKLFQIEVPVDNVVALFARETQEGMAFQFEPKPESPVEPAPAKAVEETAPKKSFLSVVR